MRYVVGLFFAILFCSNISFANMSCPKAPKPKLNFSMKKKETKFNFSKDTKQLSRENLTKSSQLAGWINEGIMSSKFPNYKIEAVVNGVIFPGANKACYWIEEIDFSWVFEPTIYVAKEYEKGSCKYRTVIAHERKHVEIDIGILVKYKDYIRKNLEKQVEKSIETGLIDASSNYDLLGKIERDLKPVIDVMVKDRTIEQGKIDTQEEYIRLGNMCR